MFDYSWVKPLIKPLMLMLAGEALAISIILVVYFAVGGEKPIE